MSAEAVTPILLRQDILDTLKRQFSVRLDALIEKSREPQVADADASDLKDQYLVRRFLQEFGVQKRCSIALVF